jgi:ferredoxin-NADP reductase
VYIDAVASNRGIRVIPVRGSTERSGHRLDPSKLESARVTSNAEIAPGIYKLSFPRSWDFVPGQSIALTLDPRVPSRFYSIASGTADPLVEVLYDLVPEGLLTPRLAELKPGDELFCSPPFGAFRDADGPSCWIATGTGIAPFVSMARSGTAEGKMLVHGSRTVAGLLDRDYFASLLDGRYVPCCTREKAEGVFPGRPTAWLSSMALPAAERFLLCGNSLMVVDARDILIGRGVKFADVVAEIYF